MLKVVVFDGGWGGEVVANYLEEELSVVEVVRVIDWKNAPYDEKSVEEIAEYAEENLQEYFGKVDLIVLGGYAVGLAKKILRERHPEQEFISPEINYDLILRARCYPEQVAILAGKTVYNSLVRSEVREKLPYSTLILPDCGGWEELINEDLMTKEILQAELAWDFILQKQKQKREKLSSVAVNGDGSIGSDMMVARKKMKPDAVLILNTHYWEVRESLEEVFGWKVRMIDFRQKLLHDVCFTLKLRGADGKRSK